MELIKKKETSLLSRIRVNYWYDDKSVTPSRLELIEAIAKKEKVKPEQVIIKHIYPQYGNRKSKIIAHIYQDPKKIPLYEHKSLIAKHQKKEEKSEG